MKTVIDKLQIKQWPRRDGEDWDYYTLTRSDFGFIVGSISYDHTSADYIYIEREGCPLSYAEYKAVASLLIDLTLAQSAEHGNAPLRAGGAA